MLNHRNTNKTTDNKDSAPRYMAIINYTHCELCILFFQPQVTPKKPKVSLHPRGKKNLYFDATHHRGHM